MRRLSAKVVRIDRLLKVAEADNTPRAALDWLKGVAERLDIAQNAPKPIVLGRHLLAKGMTPGPQMGQELKALYEAQLDGRFFNLENGLELWYNIHNSSKKS